MDCCHLWYRNQYDIWVESHVPTYIVIGPEPVLIYYAIFIHWKRAISFNEVQFLFQFNNGTLINSVKLCFFFFLEKKKFSIGIPT